MLRIEKIIILGHGAGVKFAIETIRSLNNKSKVVAVITHPYEDHLPDIQMIEQRKEMYGDYGYNTFNLPADYNIPLLEAADINQEDVIELIKSYNPDLLISIGCRNIVKENFLLSFPGKVINLHTTPLPKYRGGASDSWMILNGLSGTLQYGCSHFIDQGIDTGDIISKVPYEIPIKCYPIELFKVRMSIYPELLKRTITNLLDKNFIPELQNLDHTSVFPRLYTPLDGKIDFNYDPKELERFVYAFGYPFIGAHCMMADKKIHIMEVAEYTDIQFHPKCNGLIFGKDTNGNYKVACKNGYVKILKIEVDQSAYLQNKILKLGKFLK